MRDPELPARLLAEVDDRDPADGAVPRPRARSRSATRPTTSPAARTSIAAHGRAPRVATPIDVFYDLLMEDDGHALVLRPLLNYTDFNLDAVREMLLHPTSAWGLGDGGAHCGTTCDASTPTFMLTHWVRDRDHDRLPLEWVVRKMTSETASLYGLGDRGALAPGKLGDLNVIDHDAPPAARAGDGARPARRAPAASSRAPTATSRP